MSQNVDSSAIRFAYWVPNVSGGLVISKIEQRTSWDLDYNRKLARLAENSGFDYALSQIRFTAGYGAEFQHEPVAFSHALLAATERLKLIVALLPGPWNPVLAAKQLATIESAYERPHRRQHRQRLVQGRIQGHRRTLARTRRAVPTLGRVHSRTEGDLDSG
ncbi:MAG: LLM class flavin-dependent oxidoreductase [Polyangiaceae bacterium]